MFHKKKTYIILALVILIIGGIWYWRSRAPKAQYITAQVQRGDLAQTVSVTGKLVSPVEVDLSSKVSGRVEKLFVDIGDKVKKGQKIAVLDKGVLLSQLRQARQEVAAQKQTLSYMKRGGYKVEQKNSQRATIKEAEAAVSEIYDQLRETVIYSPLDGKVIKKSVEVGENVTANSAAGNAPIITIAQEGDLEIEANVPESDILKVALGQKADMTLDAFSTQDNFSAEVFEIEPASTVIQDVVYYKVKLKFLAPDARFKNGMSADIDIKTAEKNDVLSIPERAIGDDNGRKYVEILKDEKTGAVDRAYIATGLRGDEGMIEVTSGLNGGEKVVTFTNTP